MKKIFCLMIILLLITGCSSGNKDFTSSSEYSIDTMETTTNNEMGAVIPEEAKLDTVNIENRKVIVNGSLDLETLEFDKSVESFNNSVAKYNGYIQSSSVSDNNNKRHYYATVRIPADEYENFINEAKSVAKVTYYSESIDDITDEYTDIEAKQKSLKAEEEKLLELYKEAKTIEEIISVEERLTEIRYQIESIEARLKNYDLLTDYSTLNLSIVETNTYVKTDDNFFARLANAFVNSFANFANLIGGLIIIIVYNLWILLLIALIIILIRKVIKKKKNKE